MSDSADSKEVGLLGSASRLAKTVTAMVHTRLHLLALDLEEDRLYLLKMIQYGLLAFFCMLVGVMVLTVFVAVLFWDSHRLLVLGSLSGLFMLVGFWCWRHALALANAKPALFANSLSELMKDCQSLDGPRSSDGRGSSQDYFQ